MCAIVAHRLVRPTKRVGYLSLCPQIKIAKNEGDAWNVAEKSVSLQKEELSKHFKG